MKISTLTLIPVACILSSCINKRPWSSSPHDRFPLQHDIASEINAKNSFACPTEKKRNTAAVLLNLGRLPFTLYHLNTSITLLNKFRNACLPDIEIYFDDRGMIEIRE